MRVKLVNRRKNVATGYFWSNNVIRFLEIWKYRHNIILSLIAWPWPLSGSSRCLNVSNIQDIGYLAISGHTHFIALERQADKMSTNQSSRFDKVWKRRWAIQNYFMTLSIVKMKPLVGRICKIKDGGQIVRAGLLIIRNQTRVNTRVRMIFWQSATIIW